MSIYLQKWVRCQKKNYDVGDSLTADIQGGKNAGIMTCWYNPKGETGMKNIRPDYEIKDLLELRKIIGIA